MVLVAGATGLLGMEVCRRLVGRGTVVRALVRATSTEEKTKALTDAGVELAVGDLKEPHSLETACRGVKTVVSTASSTISRRPGDSIESVDLAGQLNLVDAARRAGVERYVFLSFRHDHTLEFPLTRLRLRPTRYISAVSEHRA